MKNISISFDEEKLSALKIYLESKNSNLEDELNKTMDMLYQRTVPANVRKYIEIKSSVSADKKVTSVRQKKPIETEPSTQGE